MKFLKNVGRFISRLYVFLRTAVANILMTLLIFFIIMAIVTQFPSSSVHYETALVLDPAGTIVEELSDTGVFSGLLPDDGNVVRETLLSNVVRAIEHAASDKRINAIVIDTSKLISADITQLKVIGNALTRFKKTKKTIVAHAHFYGQGGYLLASYADHVYMNQMGGVLLPGFGVYQNYYKELFDRLKFRMHIFKAGSFKSAVEPFSRSDMSDESRMAYQTIIDQLWRQYLEHVGANRNLDMENVNHYAQEYGQLVSNYKGDSALTAVKHLLVDELLTSSEFDKRMQDWVASEEHSFRQISMNEYLETIPHEPESRSNHQNAVGLITAVGTIGMGDQPPGSIGAENMKELINRSRDDDQIKAVVIRVDSPGGSAFASEVIRRELESLQASGKPVVISMAGVAASGGYWISATADQIWADPATITGSIGVFALVPSLEESLTSIGISTDGVGTTPITQDLNPTSDISSTTKLVLQANVDHIYRQFLEITARGRNLSVETVKDIAEGRIWTGKDAHNIGLVDELGPLNEALAAAAHLAGLDRGFRTKHLEQPRDDSLALLLKILKQSGLTTEYTQSIWSSAVMKLSSDFAFLNGPMDVYALCNGCSLMKQSINLPY